MKAKPLKLIEGRGYEDATIQEATHVKINIPGPAGELILPVLLKGTRAGTGCLSWNGDIHKPNFKPSVLIQSGHFIPGHEGSCWCKYNQEHPDNKGFTCYRCHSWINDGNVQFLADCSHELKGQIIELLDVNN